MFIYIYRFIVYIGKFYMHPQNRAIPRVVKDQATDRICPGEGCLVKAMARRRAVPECFIATCQGSMQNICIYIYIHIYIYYVGRYACMHVCMHACMDGCMYLYIIQFLCVYMYIVYIYIYALFIYIYIYM